MPEKAPETDRKALNLYAAIIIIAELLMLAMVLHVHHYPGFTEKQKTWYILTFVAIMFCSIAEFAVHCGHYSPTFAIPLTVLTVLQFSVAPTLGILFVGALGRENQARVAIAQLAVNLAVEAACAPFGLIFRFGENGYERGDFFFIYGIFYLLSLFYLIYGISKVSKRFQHRDRRTIIMVLIILVAGIIPMTFFKLNVTYLAIAIAASLCYIHYNDLVQQDVQDELVDNQKKMSDMQYSIISGLADLVESRDLETGEHVARTSAYVKMLSEFAAKDGVYSDVIDEEFVEKMQMLAPLHDIGKIVVPDAILQKPGKLTEEEFEEIKKHTTAGGKIVRRVLDGVADEGYLSFASDIATGHHERWDGNGYPAGLAGEDIPLSARIMAIADVFDALVSERCYKSAMSADEAFKIIEEESGTHFDAALTDVFLRHRKAFVDEMGRIHK